MAMKPADVMWQTGLTLDNTSLPEKPGPAAGP